MKKFYDIILLMPVLIVCSVVSHAQTSCANISAGLYSTDPHNIYYGVRVTLDQTYPQSITVSGNIVSGNPNISPVAFSLSVSPGNLTQETYPSYYESSPGTYATASITSITPVIVTKNGVSYSTQCSVPTPTNNGQILAKFNNEFNTTQFNDFVNQYNLGSFNKNNASVDSVTNGSNVGKFVKVPVFKNNSQNATIVGVINSYNVFDYQIVQIASADTVTITYYSLNDGPAVRLKIFNKALLSSTIIPIVPSPKVSCIGNYYKGCAGKPPSTLCSFTNDWWGGFCNKTFWVSAVLHCSGTWYHFICGGW